ncbi:hypothetical protein B0H21DRAFT_702028 [Amylocystis lapponica]|nr:hypothetical protein B0H21DRAFT_702028 [Amylocystis lapponica]
MDRRLLRASQDDVGYRDFADYSAGARPIEPMTSLTYTLPTTFYERIFARKRIVPRPPSSALKRDVQPGNCWPMSGSSGYIGVKLSDPIVVTSVTIEHLPATLARDITTAPRSFVLWGLLDRSALPGPVLRASDDVAHNSLPSSLIKHVSHDFVLVVLAEFQYDIWDQQHVQTFQVQPHYPPVKMDTAIFQIRENWGSDNFTCIYRLRVHGDMLL